MGLQFILGLRARRNRRSNPGDSGYPGSVRENTLGNCCVVRLGDAKMKAAWSSRSRRPFVFLSAVLRTAHLMLRVLGDKQV